jgi:hypothetical protein
MTVSCEPCRFFFVGVAHDDVSGWFQHSLENRQGHAHT